MSHFYVVRCRKTFKERLIFHRAEVPIPLPRRAPLANPQCLPIIFPSGKHAGKYTGFMHRAGKIRRDATRRQDLFFWKIWNLAGNEP